MPRKDSSRSPPLALAIYPAVPNLSQNSKAQAPSTEVQSHAIEAVNQRSSLRSMAVVPTAQQSEHGGPRIH